MLRAPLRLALRRLRARPLSALGLALAFGAAAALIGWSSMTAALSQEHNVRHGLRHAGPLHVLYFTLPLETDFRADTVDETFASFRGFTAPPQRVRISHSIETNQPLGTRLVTAREPARDIRLDSGRLPERCCEVVALGGKARVGDRVRLGAGVSGIVVGTGSVRRSVLPEQSELGRRSFLLRRLPPKLEQLVAQHGSTVVTSARLEPRKVHGFALDGLRQRWRVASVRLQLGDSLVRTSAPTALLSDLAHRGKVARERVLLVAGEGAALIIAFAAFLSLTRRRETEQLETQLTVLGASRGQALATRVLELAAPCLLGLVVALGALALAALVVAHAEGIPTHFVAAALPWTTVLVALGVGVFGVLLLLAGRAPEQRARIGAFELAAVTALGIVAWEAATTGALDPARVAASGAAPVLLLVPALAFFGVGVVLLRVLPYALRAGARHTRNASTGVRLALLGAARNPGFAAATTTFLAVALGASLFSLDYRATLDRQGRDQAAFTAGADWRLVGAHVTRPTHALRLDGVLDDDQVPATVLAIPAARLTDVRGWRGSFSGLSREEIATRLRPRQVAMSGPALAPDATELRVHVRARTDYPRRIVLHLLLPGDRFATFVVGYTGRRPRVLRTPIPSRYRGAHVVAVAFEPTYVPISFKYEPNGYVDLGPLQQRTTAGWTTLPSLADWLPTVAPTGTAGVLIRRGAGIRFELQGTFRPLIHPSFGLPPVRSGFVVGDVPALASAQVAEHAVDGLVVVDLPGFQVPVHVVATARLFPTVTERPKSFLVFDYDTLFAALNADQPGLAVPSEAWVFGGRQPAHAAVSLEGLTRAAERDPLAAGMRDVLAVTGVLAAVLGLLGLALATRSALSAERLQLAEYEALGVPPRTLRRSAQLRLAVLSAFGIVAGALGAFLSGRLVGAFVAVTGTARRPLPPIESVVSWPSVVVVVITFAVAGGAAAALLAQRQLRGTAAGRLRA